MPPALDVSQLPGATVPVRSAGDPRLAPAAGLEWFVAKDERALTALAPHWQRLSHMAGSSMFGSPEWNQTWWRHFRDRRTLHVVGGHRDGELVALAPLCTRRTAAGVRIREFLGAEERDWATFLLAPGEETLAKPLVRLMLADSGWDLVDLWSLPAQSVTAQALDGLRTARNGYVTLDPFEANPVLDLGRFPDQTSHSFLSTIRRKRRALGRQGAVELVMAEGQRVARALDDLRLLHAARWGERKEISRLQLPSYWEWVRGLALEAAGLGWLCLPRLVLDGRVVATGVYFLYGRRLFYWIGAFDPAFGHYSPYHVLTLTLIEEMQRRGAADVFDFGRGGEPYKLHWAHETIPLLRATARRGLRGGVAYFWQARVRKWAWEHQAWSRPVRRTKRAIQRALVRKVGWPA